MNLNPTKACSVELTIKILLLQLMESIENLQKVIFREESMMTEVVSQVNTSLLGAVDVINGITIPCRLASKRY
jgi:hypothetical protein